MMSQLQLLLLLALFRPAGALQCFCTGIRDDVLQATLSSMNDGAACLNGKCTIESGAGGQASCLTVAQLDAISLKACTRWTPVKMVRFHFRLATLETKSCLFFNLWVVVATISTWICATVISAMKALLAICAPPPPSRKVKQRQLQMQ